jgi:hypothetical protein
MDPFPITGEPYFASPVIPRLRAIASGLGITERWAHEIVNDLADAGYVRTHSEGRRNRYEIQEHLSLSEDPERETPIGDVLQILSGRRPAWNTRTLAH